MRQGGMLIRVLSATALALALPGFGVAGASEPLPQPQIDYVAHGTFIGGGKMTMRHRGGLLRLDMDMPGIGLPMTGYFDMRTRKALLVVPSPTGKMGMEVAATDQAGYGALAGTGERGERIAIAGEPCDLWTIDAPQAAGAVTSCITPDGIALRTETTVHGKREVAFEVSSLIRSAQEPALFVPPADIKIMPMPARPVLRPAPPSGSR